MKNEASHAAFMATEEIRPVQRQLVLDYILSNQKVTTNKLVRELKIAKSSIAGRLSELQDLGLIIPLKEKGSCSTWYPVLAEVMQVTEARHRRQKQYDGIIKRLKNKFGVDSEIIEELENFQIKFK